MWRWVGVVGLLIATALGTPHATAQVGFDRPGSDYNRVEMHNGDPSACAARCEREQRCRAWAFNYPMDENSSAVCWLKSRVPMRVTAPFSVSGVRGGGVIEPISKQIEFSIDRFGGDYRNFQLGSEPDGKSCREACEGDNRCRAWTYVRAGYGVSGPRCYLKDRVTPPRRRPCCISGVMR